MFAKHNFKQNFFSANGSGDDVTTKDILVTEVEKIIVDRPQDLIDVMLSSGIKIKVKPTRMDLINAFFNNLSNSEFQKNLAFLIVDNTQNPMYGELKSNFSAGELFGKAGATASTNTKPGSTGGTKVGADPVSSVANALSSVAGLFGSIKDGKNIKEQSKANMIANLQAQQLASQQQPQGMSTSTKWMLGFGGLIFVGIIVMAIMKSRQK